jgi:hypothetical protein
LRCLNSPERWIMAVEGFGSVSATILLVLAHVEHDRRLYRPAFIVIGVTVAVAALPLVAAIVLMSVDRAREWLRGKRR